MTPELRDGDITLRIPLLADAERIMVLLDNFAVSGNLARVPFPYSTADARGWLSTRHPALPPGQTTFAILLEGEGLIGHVGLHQVDRNTPAELGYWLGEPFWGRGIMSRAAAMTLRWYLAKTDASAVRSGAFAFNAPSLAIQKRLGFIERGRSQVHCLARGQALAHIDTELSRAAWAERQAQ